MSQPIEYSTVGYLSTIAATCGCLGLVFTYFYCKNVYSYWERKGIKGPKPLPIIGNVHSLLLNDRMKLELDWVAKYGKVYGMYFGLTPYLIVADPETLVQICVKDFDAFPNHENKVEFFEHYGNQFIFNSADDVWKRSRALLTPAFTSTKIKRMFKFLDSSSNHLVKCGEKQVIEKSEKKADINIRDLFELYTMDGVTTCCYNLRLEREDSKDLKSLAFKNEFVHLVLRITKVSKARLLGYFSIPAPIKRKLKFTLIRNDIVEQIVRIIKQFIKHRSVSDKKPDDFLQLLLDARTSDKLELNEKDSEENHHISMTSETLETDRTNMIKDLDGTRLTEHEILANAVYIIGVANETTTSLLVHCTYLLAFNKDVQEKLYEEVSKLVVRNEESKEISFDYDAITSCRYLDAVISETLRILSPVVFSDRQLKRDYYLEKYNLNLPAGLKVNLGIYAVQNDPDFWSKPDVFDPERFMPGNKDKVIPGSYVPFGIGPRHCLGMRFALTEAKLGVAKILTHFHLEPTPGTTFPTTTTMPIGTQIISKPFVRLVARSH